MQETIIGGARIPAEALASESIEIGEDARRAGELEVERQSLAFREFFSGDPKAALMSLLDRVTALEEALAGLGGLESQLAEAREKLDARPETVIPDTGPETIETSYDEPPAEIADLIDPSLTPRQNLDVLTAKFAAAKNLEEYARNNGDMTGAMQHLRDAERFESGIKWNRAVLVEVV